jgi:hypothetical protein
MQIRKIAGSKGRIANLIRTGLRNIVWKWGEMRMQGEVAWNLSVEDEKKL